MLLLAVFEPARDCEGIFGVELTLLVDGSFTFASEVLEGECGETGLAAEVVGLVTSSSEESPPARASNSASRSAILRVDNDRGWLAFVTEIEED